ncbi:hypothetical protein DF286_04850 [Sphingosinicella humi]|uniref:DUF4139 domain-containing protein n=2 Tax=Allosphingosinicella humi TaxID=2068657 RepID=A0A2U2J1S0_9SPHN|nr:hypothetical protein DF286_04850 [Sphingosinicella humi]
MLLMLTPAAAAQSIATSPGPSDVSLTVYRAPHRSPGDEMNLRWLNGYALISETRTVSIPAGESEIRFEGVAGGIIPESAIVTGFPDGVIEKNQDAHLLSPASLLDASLGRRVHLRRTSGVTGEVTETEAVIRSGADGAVVLETPAGFEALRCTGLNETLIYDRVPAGLSAKPTLSVRVRSAAPVTQTVTLSYLATGFDWQANYVAELSADGEMDLFAWLTLANGDETGFAEADTYAVAGTPNREGVATIAPPREPISLRCWPAGTTTSDLSLPPPPPSAPPPPPPAPIGMAVAESIIVTGARAPVAMMAEQEALGELKLYRIPEPVTVAANSQKQVALLQRSDVPIEIIYRRRVGSEGQGGATPVVTARNSERGGLGLPLPSGEVAFFQAHEGRRVLIGQGRSRDLAVGEAVEVELGESIDVQTRVERLEEFADGGGDYRLTVTNAKNRPVPFEAELFTQGQRLGWSDARLADRNGRPLWRVTVPANGSAILRYRLEPQDR